MEKKRSIIILAIVVLLAGCATAEGLRQYKGEGFCGSSTYGKCASDADCIQEGCSREVCQSINESTVITTCQWKECYDAEAAGVFCKCLAGKCRWAKGAQEVSSVEVEDKAEEKAGEKVK